jgi:molybdopterin-binding protein
MFPTGYQWITVLLILHYSYVSEKGALLIKGGIQNSQPQFCQNSEKLKNYYRFYCGNIEVQEQGGTTMKLSARNILKGKVVQIKAGAVNTEVILELPGGAQIVSIITKESADNLGLAVGKPAYAVIKASSVMIAVD